MNAAELFVCCLESEGVEYVFGLPGEENIDVMDALLDSGIRFVLARHKQGAAFHDNLVKEVGIIAHARGVNSPRDLERYRGRIVCEFGRSNSMDELYALPSPGSGASLA